MKHTLLFILLLVSIMPLAVHAAAKYEIDGIYYYLKYSTKTAEVTYNNQNKYSGDIVIPSTVTLDDVEYSVTAILGQVFAKCPDLTSVTIPSSVTSLGKSVFENSANLTTIIIEEGNPVYDSRENCNAVIETASNKLLFGCKGTMIPNSVTTIGESAFYNCSGLTTINIPNSVTNIEKESFRNCSGLTYIKVGNGVTTIGEGAFAGCSYMTKVELNCNEIISKDYDPNEYYRPPSYFGSQVKEFILGEDVTRIGEYAFARCGINTMNIPKNVTSIGDYAFSDCYYLVEVGISSSISEIPQWTFYMCQKLSKVVINSNALVSKNYESRPSIFGFTCKDISEIILGEDVKDLGSHVFCNLPKLSSVTISNSLTRMSAGAFKDCPSLTDIYCYAEQVPTIYDYSVEEFNYTNATLHVPEGSLDAYRNTEPWKDFKEIVALSHREYHPFIEENKVWKVGVDSRYNPVQLVEYYYFDGETIIGGKTCKQMMRQRYVNPDYPEYDAVSQQPSLSYVGAWYEEDKKVYFYDANSKQMKLMYDFSLDTNETLEIDDQQYLIGPELTGAIKGFKGVSREITLCSEGMPFIYDTTWLEGVGGIGGPTVNNFYGNRDNLALFMMSCTVGDEVIYLNDEYEDGASPSMGARKRRIDFTHTIKIKPKTRIKKEKNDAGIDSSEREVARPKVKGRTRGETEESVYGEYNDQQLCINLDPLDDTYLVSITSESGKPVYEKEINAGNIVGLNIDISSYVEGRYTVIVENSRESFKGEFGAQTTGIKEVSRKQEALKDHIYNFQGQRLNSLQKGLNIVNGQKIYVK
ncbi:MAG: leucine-rich repeat domain-containing protein [Prevotella sp.]|nr:leucine-rich repeat domain-containing protein [Prevotella sp.]